MKRVSKIIKWIVSAVLLAYVCLIILLHFPFAQQQVGHWAADFLSKTLGTHVEVGRVNLGFLNRVFVDNLRVDDQRGKPMLDVRRLAVTFDVQSLWGGQIEINTVQVFGLDAHLYRDTPDSPLNAQFVLDSLSSSDPSQPKKPLNLAVHSLLLRRCNVTYDVWNRPVLNTFSTDHLDVRDLALTAKFRLDERNSRGELQLQRLAFRERQSGLAFNNLQTHVSFSHDTLQVDSLRLALPHSLVAVGQSRVDRNSVSVQHFEGELCAADFSPFLSRLQSFSQTVRLRVPQFQMDSLSIRVPSLQCAMLDDSICVDIDDADVQRWRTSGRVVNLPRVRMQAQSPALAHVAGSLDLPEIAGVLLQRAGEVGVETSLLYSAQEASAEGKLSLDAGNVDFQLRRQDTQSLSAQVEANVDVESLLGDKSEGIGRVVGQAQLERSSDAGYKLLAQLDSVYYEGHVIQQVTAEADYDNTHTLTASLLAADAHADIHVDALWQREAQHLVAEIQARRFEPHAMGLTDGLEDKSFSFNLTADVSGHDWRDLLGAVSVDSFSVTSPDDVTAVRHLSLQAQPVATGRLISAQGDFIDGSLVLTPQLAIQESAFDVQFRDIPVHLTAQGTLDSLLTSVHWQTEGKATIVGDLEAALQFDRDSFSPRAVRLLPSAVTIDDTLWTLNPATVTFGDSRVYVDGVRLVNGTRYLGLDGTLSTQASDSLVCTMNDIEVAYVLSLVDFHAVRFGGKAFGGLVLRRPNGQMQYAAQLRVDDFTLNEGRLGTAYILAGQDKATGGVRLDANILDKDSYGFARHTTCSGYVAPAKNDLHLTIQAQHTSVSFMNGFLKSTFRDIDGSVDGTLHVVGPLSDVGLEGDMVTDMALTLRPTSVRYRVSREDTLRFRPYRFVFQNVGITDSLGNKGVLNGRLTHRNMKNFGYDFQIDADKLLLYEEREWNSDKFMGTVFGDGRVRIQGSDGHPLHINAEVTPTRGSVFAYDAATPDAITSSGFITFHDPSLRQVADSIATGSAEERLAGWLDDYTGDVFMDANIHMNPQCELRLRMDQTNDAYISAFGTGNLQAHYYNKGPFTLDGTYNIVGGRYRLYLQDIIYRDLLLQTGSNVIFNGNPFDAALHLVCHHTLQAVPITDLLGNSASAGTTSRVKVVCVLDITGHLGNMVFGFDLQLPNVNDEVRSIVRSLISTDEEMNRQIIYLLGLGRFYTAEYALASGDNVSSDAMNSLLSSTLSGQINQMLEGVIGQDSRWNFGTGLTTGEQGWQDLDVEGILSGHLLDDRLLVNGNFGYRNNTLTQNASFIGDFDVKWRLREGGNTYLKAYNRANDRYFTKATLNTQGIGISYQKDFENWGRLFARSRRKEKPSASADSTSRSGAIGTSPVSSAAGQQNK